MICIPVLADTMDEMLALLRQAATEPADLIELRLDTLREPIQLEPLLQASPFPTIVTCRAQREGGHWEGSEDDRIALLEAAMQAGAAYVDVEADCLARIERKGSAQIIASMHDFEKTPADLLKKVQDIAAQPCDIVKFATMAHNLEDNLRVFEAIEQCPKKAIGLCMGEYGEPSRILTLRYGGLLTFGSLARGRESAPGQIPAADLAHLYRVNYITSDTALYGVVGNPIAHSMSPEIHNTAFSLLDMDAVYLRFKVDDFPAFLQQAERLGVQGLSVTLPHKGAALEASSTVDPLAKSIGSVNTLQRMGTSWHGSNTDCLAALGSIQEAANSIGLQLNGATALLLGAGGTARAIGFGLKDAGCKVLIANRTRARAEDLATDLGAEVVDLETAHTVSPQIVANTTSLGMHPNIDGTPIDPSVFREGVVAFDAIYNPPETRMLREARMNGAAIADGLSMFAGQAARQFETWTGQMAPYAAMEQIVEERLGLLPEI